MLLERRDTKRLILDGEVFILFKVNIVFIAARGGVSIDEEEVWIRRERRESSLVLKRNDGCRIPKHKLISRLII